MQSLPLQMVDLVCELSLLSPLRLIRFILQHLDALPAPRLVLAGLSHRVQLPHLVLHKMEGAGRGWAGGREKDNNLNQIGGTKGFNEPSTLHWVAGIMLGLFIVQWQKMPLSFTGLSLLKGMRTF